MRRVCLGELAREAASGEHARAAAAIVPGATFVVQSQQLPVVRSLLRMYRVRRRDVVLVHISDGNIWQHRAARTAKVYRPWRAAFRQYWLPDATGALAAAARAGDVEWFPIGMNPQWVRRMEAVRTGALAVPRASERAHFVSFLGSTGKSARRERIRQVDAALQLLRTVRSMRRAAEEGGGGAPAVRRHADDADVACYGSECNDEAYVRGTLDAALCLALPGSSVESNRLYESLEGGCVPLVITSYGPGEEAVGTVPSEGDAARAAVTLAYAPLANVTGEPPPFVVVATAAELPAALAPLAESAEALDALQRRARDWWDAAKRHYARRFAAAVCPRAAGEA